MTTASTLLGASVSQQSRTMQLALAVLLGDLHRRFCGLLASRRRPQCARTTIAIRWRSPATDRRPAIHDTLSQRRLHRGARRPVGRVAMTAMQMFTTVPLILQAEVYENAGAAAEHDHAAAPADRRPAPRLQRRHTSTTRRPGRRPTASSAIAFTVLANLVSGIGFALILVAVSEFAGGIGSWRQGLFWGLAGFCRVHAGARPRPAAGASRHARRRALPAAGLVDGDGRLRPQPAWR